ncbi:MAG: 2OG-Fe(II) oxygenase family protein [Acidimicrobiales bacterium]|nr:2OG-Fe(II) oxygenase family protein [Acidimicrobiales bacterium]
MQSETLRVIDLGPCWTGGEAGKEAVAREIGRACEEIGFFLIVNHGVDDDLVLECRALAREFFDLPLPDKQRVAQPKPGLVRGYREIGTFAAGYEIDESSPGELREDFAIGPIDPPADDYHQGPRSDDHFWPNTWPDEPAGLRGAWTRYYRAMEVLSTEMAGLFARALALPPTFFADKNDRHISMLKVINYPDQIDEPAEGEVRIRAHGDLGDFTILHHEKTPGSLEVETRAGEWIEVPAVPGGYVVNLGDLMMRWTNDRWISTKHRVVNPPRDQAANSRRMSMPFFHQPNYDALIACLPSCTSADDPPRYEPITSGDYLRQRYLVGSVGG